MYIYLVVTVAMGGVKCLGVMRREQLHSFRISEESIMEK